MVFCLIELFAEEGEFLVQGRQFLSEHLDFGFQAGDPVILRPNLQGRGFWARRIFTSRHFRRPGQQLGIAMLLAPWLPGKLGDQRRFPFGQFGQDRLHRRKVGEGVHALAPGAQFAEGLGTAQQELAEDRQFGWVEMEFGR
jgi:hypothetical protein